MCGIFGLHLNRPLTEDDIALGRAGAEALSYRGPDDAGEWFDREAGVYFGHRRLSIIDLSPGGRQPMVRDDHALTCNGEIYNFRPIGRALRQAGIGLSTQSDSEVLLQALRHWGEAALDRLDGMFAFAYWDGTRTTLAVDPFGEKPLYYAITDDGLYFASELRPLARLLKLEVAIDDENWAAFLSLGYIPGPQTIYPAVRRLEPASVMRVAGGAAQTPRRYWSMPVGQAGRGAPQPLSENDLDRLCASLIGSLEGRLVADVPIGLFLSAGIDSSLIAALCRQELGRSLECLTVAFPAGDVVDECAAAAAVAAYLDLPHRVLENRTDPESAGIARVVDLFGQPSGNSAILPVDQLCATATRHYKVGLTGLGGDEMTWGYGKNQTYWRWRRVFGLPGPVRQAAGLVGRIVGGRAARFGNRIGAATTEIYLANKNFPALPWLKALPGFDSWSKRAFDDPSPMEFAVPLFDANQVMPNMQLPAFDHASMRHGLELRTPFLNRDVAETVAQFDPRALLAFGQKGVLRRLLGRYLPEELFDRPKTGFTFPDEFIVGNAPAPGPVRGLPQSAIDTVWRHRTEPGGWRLLALRLLSAAHFFHSERVEQG
ncbi:MAG: asparagine synthase (glutamine-hydrolyzing) [Alphaproteobacteria bacterium]|nr:asparagine synthase (glutamine-hydrolyzing) [Alphaproteobacteria bacterium]